MMLYPATHFFYGIRDIWFKHFLRESSLTHQALMSTSLDR